MVKRRAVAPDSDTDEQSSQFSHPSKRARTEEDSADELPETSQNGRKRSKRTNGAEQHAEDDDDDRPALDLDDDDEPIELDIPDEDEERRFEEEHEEEIRAKLASKTKTLGVSAAALTASAFH